MNIRDYMTHISGDFGYGGGGSGGVSEWCFSECTHSADISNLSVLSTNTVTPDTYTFTLADSLVDTLWSTIKMPETENTEPKEEAPMQRMTIPMPTRMLVSGPAVIVFFADDTKVVVKCPEDVEFNEYNAFCAAIAKKMYGTNTQLKRQMEKIRVVVPTEAERREALNKARKEAEEKRKAQEEARLYRRAKQIAFERKAKELAKSMKYSASEDWE